MFDKLVLLYYSLQLDDMNCAIISILC